MTDNHLDPRLNTGQNITKSFGYEQTLMGGHYVTEELAQIASQIRQDMINKQQLQTKKHQLRYEKARELEQSSCYKCFAKCGSFLKAVTDKIGEDWVFLTVLGVVMAILSFLMDFCISKLLEAHNVMYVEAGRIHFALQIAAWVGYPVLLILFSTYYVNLVAPNAIGSGIPEMKTILRGVVLKEYLTLRTLLSKMLGLTTSLGSGLPFGKEGPFVHIASIVATLLSKTFSSFRGIYENESRNNEMLAAAAATGVACTFAAPIGGVLFSIEVTATYFAVRNYWRGFFSAVCAAILFRLLAIVFEDEQTVTALFKTFLRHDFPFDVAELIAFASIGVVSGFAGAAFVLVHRRFIFLMRRNKKFSASMQKYRFLYPLIVTVIISCLTCPNLTGQYMGGGVTFRKALSDFFSNVTWSYRDNEMLTVEHQQIISRWEQPYIWTSLTLYMVFLFFMSAIAITLPVPSGVFIPVFAMGAALGRMIGELVYTFWPDGINMGRDKYIVVPGGYAVVGAAALSGAVTHTISTSMIVFELTGQMSHILPCVLAVLIANAIANALQPSIYDSIIQIKHLPYLPNFLPTNAQAHRLCAEDIMLRDVKCISHQTTYETIRGLLTDNLALRSFPLVDDTESMILLGSIQRQELIRLLELHLSRGREAANGDLNRLKHVQENGKKGYKKKNGRPRSTAKSDCEEERDRSLSIYTEKMKASHDRHYETIGAPERSNPKKSILKKSNTNPNLKDAGSRSRSQPSSPTTSPRNSQGKFANLQLTQMFVKNPRMSSSHETLNSGTSEDETDFTEYTPLTSHRDGDFVSMPAESRDASHDASDTVDSASHVCFNLGLTPTSPRGSKVVKLPPMRVVDMPFEKQIKLEQQLLQEKLDFNECHVDPAPFQLVEKTSLYKVHSIFSLLGLNRAYVTNVGRLVGVVSLKELQGIMLKLTFPHIDYMEEGTDFKQHRASESEEPGIIETASDLSFWLTTSLSQRMKSSNSSSSLSSPIRSSELPEIVEEEEETTNHLSSRFLPDARSARYSPLLLRSAISGPSIVGVEPPKKVSQALAMMTSRTLSSTIGGVEMEFDKVRSNSVSDKKSDEKTKESHDSKA